MTLIGWILALTFGAGGGYMAFKRWVEKGTARRDLEAELDRKAKEMKDDEAKILAEPAADKRATLDRMRKNRDA